MRRLENLPDHVHHPGRGQRQCVPRRRDQAGEAVGVPGRAAGVGDHLVRRARRAVVEQGAEARRTGAGSAPACAYPAAGRRSSARRTARRAGAGAGCPAAMAALASASVSNSRTSTAFPASASAG